MVFSPQITILPVKATLVVTNNQNVQRGQTLVKIPKDKNAQQVLQQVRTALQNYEPSALDLRSGYRYLVNSSNRQKAAFSFEKSVLGVPSLKQAPSPEEFRMFVKKLKCHTWASVIVN